jgi:hypothetical protein
VSQGQATPAEALSGAKRGQRMLSAKAASAMPSTLVCELSMKPWAEMEWNRWAKALSEAEGKRVCEVRT